MRQTLLLSMAGLTANALKFTAPSTSEPLDLTKNITVSWDTSSSDPEFFKINFRVVIAGTFDEQAYFPINFNATSADGSFEWDTEFTYANLEIQDWKAEAGKQHFFEAIELDKKDVDGGFAESERYAIGNEEVVVKSKDAEKDKDEEIETEDDDAEGAAGRLGGSAALLTVALMAGVVVL